MLKSRIINLFLFALLLLASFETAKANSLICSELFVDRTSLSLADSPANLRIHEKITHDLFNGEILSVQPFKGGLVYKLHMRIFDSESHSYREFDALFKPRIPGDFNSLRWRGSPLSIYGGWGRSPMEYIAYHLNRLIGLDDVPPAAYRRNLNISINGEHFTEGAFLYLVENVEMIAEGNQTPSFSGLSRNILDYLLQNPDGAWRANNGVGTHWADGQPHKIYFDFSASGSRMRYHQAPTRVYFPPGKIRELLARLNVEDFRGAIDSDLISENEVKRILERRDLMLTESIDYDLRMKNDPQGLLMPEYRYTPDGKKLRATEF